MAEVVRADLIPPIPPPEPQCATVVCIWASHIGREVYGPALWVPTHWSFESYDVPRPQPRLPCVEASLDLLVTMRFQSLLATVAELIHSSSVCGPLKTVFWTIGSDSDSEST